MRPILKHLLIAGQMSGGGFVPQELINSLVGCWRLDSPGARRADSVGYNPLSDNNTVLSDTGIVYPLASKFAGANSESLSRVSNSVVQAGDIKIWLAAWVYLESKAANCGLVTKYNFAASKREYTLLYNSSSDRFRFQVSNDGSAVISAIDDQLGSPSLNTWYLIFGWHDSVANQIGIATNGLTPTLTSHATGVFSSDSPFSIGSHNNSADYLTGRVAQVMLGKSYIPVAADRAYVYRNGSGSRIPGLAHSFSVQSAQTLESGTGTTDWCGRCVLLKDGDKWVRAYRQASTHLYNSSNPSVIHIKFSLDEGVTWTAADTYTNGSPVTGAPFGGHSGGDAAEPLLILCPNGDYLLHVGEKINDNQDGQGTWQFRSTNGGASWSDEGRINDDDDLFGGQDYTVVGNDIYITAVVGAWTSPMKSVLYKSTDNGTTWTHVSDITSTANKTNEAGIIWTGGNTLLTILRDDDDAKTYKRISTDLGATWGTLTDVTSFFAVLQRARMRSYGDEPDRIYLWGRDKYSLISYMSLYYSDDDGANWRGPFYPDTGYDDTAYGDMLKRANGQFVLYSYGGTHSAAVTREYVLAKD